MKEFVSNPKRLQVMRIRFEVEQAIRDYFLRDHFLETRTPLLVRSPGMEPHIRPMQVAPIEGQLLNSVYLPTSPEFAMKRLLVGGLEKIFQMTPAFRSEPESATHHPEFLMLEWYRAHAPLEKIQEDVENIFREIAKRLKKAGVLQSETKIHYQGNDIHLASPWPRLRVADLFFERWELDIARASIQEWVDLCRSEGFSEVDLNWDWDDLFFLLWLNRIEPALPKHHPVFITDYPASQAALATVRKDAQGNTWANRFEVFAGGHELGNAFNELTDPYEQRSRFEKDMALRNRKYGSQFPASPIDEAFMQALHEGMPPSSGIAMGVDRMVMLFADVADIRWTHWLPSYWPMEGVTDFS